MPISKPGGKGGNGGGGRSLGPSPNVFGTSTTTNRAAAETLRNTQATDDTDWLALYNDDRGNFIQLVWDDGDVVQRRNVAGDAWEDVTDILVGPPGPQGETGGATSKWISHFKGDINWTATRTFVAAGTAIPDDASEIAVRLGGASSGAEVEGAQWFIFPIADFKAIVASAVGAISSNGDNVRALVDWAKDTLTGGFLRRDTLVGRTSANIVLVGTENTAEDAYNLEVMYRKEAPAAGGSSIQDGTGGLPQASEDNEGEVRIDRNTLIEYISVKRHYTTSVAGGTWADIPSRTDFDVIADRFLETAVLNDYIYETDQNQFFVGAQIASGRVGWIHDSPGNALETSLASAGNIVHWLGEHEADSVAMEFIPSLAATTEYFYYNFLTQEIRRLTNSTFTAPGAPVAYYTWLPVRADPSVKHAGFVVDVSSEHSPPTPNKANNRNIYIDKSVAPPRIWLPHDTPRPDTAASVTSTIVPSASAGYRGARFSPPASHAGGDFYYDRTAHVWRAQSTVTTFFSSVTWTELKNVARSSGSLFFNGNDVWVNEVITEHQAAEIIQNAGYNSDGRDYYWMEGGVFRLLNVFTAAVNNRLDYSYFAMQAGTPPPTGIWYMNAQTSRWPSSYSYDIDPTSSRLRLRWTGGDPDESLYGWDSIGDIFVAGADVSANIDGSANPATNTSFVVFQPPAGIYDIEVHAGTADETITEEFGIFLYQIQSGDDLILATTSGKNSDLPANFGGTGGTVFRMDLPDYEFDGSQQLYVMAFTGNADAWRGYLKIVKKA